MRGPKTKESARRSRASRRTLALVIATWVTSFVSSRAFAEEQGPAEIAPPAAPPSEAPREVTVKGRTSEARRLQESAEAVTVVDTYRARKQSSDLGEVMARTQGVAVRRAGGLGANARFSLNGLYDDQIRFFLDGVPLELAGYPFGIANVPVNLVERVDVYRGVVPIRFGADALGGAVNLVTNRSYDIGASASYQIGSFGTNRLTLTARTRHEPSGFVVSGMGFLDLAKNNYRVDVEVPNSRGRLVSATVPRFHDAYGAGGGSIELGFVDKPWARRLLLKGFASTYDKQLQNNTVMTVPYGEATYGESLYGATLRYEQPLLPDLELEAMANYAYRVIDFTDRSKWVYDWFGRRVRERGIGGEILADQPTDTTVWEHSVLARTTLGWTVAPGHVVHASVSPTFTTRTGDERIQTDPNARDPLNARRDLLTVVSGLDYQLDAFTMPGRGGATDYRLENVVFAKDYIYSASSEEVLTGGGVRPRDLDSHRLGLGDSVRFRFTPWAYAKASYEYATRLPRPDEVFGDGKLVSANLQLEPEVSHNANVGPHFELRRTPVGEFTADVNGFWRDSDRLIVMLSSDRFFSYQNVFRARALGVEGSALWTSPGRWLSLDGSTTFQDVRNTGDEGAFKAFDGDRIPNRPWLFASWGARLRFPHVLTSSDELEPFYVGRYVHSFYRGWESQGVREFKQVVDAQLTHGVGLTYSVWNDLTRVASTFEVQNLTDARVYDYFGVQRPGRAFFIKLTAEL